MSSSPPYNIAYNEDGQSVITLFSKGEVITIDGGHPNHDRIAHALLNGEDPVRFLSIAQAIIDMDERVVILGNTVHFDGEPIHNTLARTILRYTTEGRDTTGLVKFMERLAENPSARGREVIFEWVADRDLTIMEDGRFVGWKGVGEDFRSQSSGTAYVDGVKYENQRIPNKVGSVVSMPRTEVMDDPNQDCHVGLHIGTHQYAKGFGSTLLEVAIDPADVVSVPARDTSWKIRCCQYEVLAIHESEQATFDTEYEAEAEFDAEVDLDEALETVVPGGFLARMRARKAARQAGN